VPGVTSRTGGDVACGGDVTRGEGGSAARAIDEGVRAGKGDPRRERLTRGSARGRGIRGKKTVVGKGQRYASVKDSAKCVKRTVRQGWHQRVTRMASTWDKDDAL